jgi:3-hydroxyisobutyrate dehydrogenase-like beta-hydroxyacid dehydrogenase
MTRINQRISPRLGFIGMGGMGSRMAGRLLSAGYNLRVYNRNRDATRLLELKGARVAETPRDLAANADVVITCVADDAAIESVMTGSDGALAGARPGTIFIEMSTVSPAVSRRMYEAALRKEVSLLDAPVSGSTPQADQGQLVIFVGGERSVYDRCWPILGVLGRESFYMGPAGSGTTMKLCVNTLLGLGMQALAEAITLGLKAGLERDCFLKVLSDTAVISPSQKSKLENARMDSYPPTFPIRLMSKDFGLILDTASDLSVQMPATAAANRVFATESARQSAIGREEDFSSVIRAVEQTAGVS